MELNRNEIELLPEKCVKIKFYVYRTYLEVWFDDVDVAAFSISFCSPKQMQEHTNIIENISIVWRKSIVLDIFFWSMLHKSEHRTKVFDMQLITQSGERERERERDHVRYILGCWYCTHSLLVLLLLLYGCHYAAHIFHTRISHFQCIAFLFHLRSRFHPASYRYFSVNFHSNANPSPVYRHKFGYVSKE